MPTKKKKNLLVDHPAWTERLSEEWDWEKNDKMGVKPDEVTAGSNKKAWWIGRDCGHEWEARVRDRAVLKRGCRVCGKRTCVKGVNDLTTTHPLVSLDWFYDRNGDLLPENVTSISSKVVWWRCSQCGYEWTSRISRRASEGHGCPSCLGQAAKPGVNDLATLCPSLLDEWDTLRNGNMRPEQVAAGSAKMIHWKCSACGHAWVATANNRKNGRGCPECAKRRRGELSQKPSTGGSLADLYPNLISEWSLNNAGDSFTYRANSGQKAEWVCSVCGHRWRAVIASRTSGGCGCPKCASSHGEKDSASWAVSQGFVVDEQWRHPDCRDKNPLPFDLMLYVPVGNALMEVSAVEYDGIQHSDETTYFNKKNLTTGRGFDYVQRHDAIKTAFCMSTHRILIRVPYTVTGEEAIGEYISEKLRENGLGWAIRRNGEEVA